MKLGQLAVKYQQVLKPKFNKKYKNIKILQVKAKEVQSF